jgi:hypothetical protein
MGDVMARTVAAKSVRDWIWAVLTLVLLSLLGAFVVLIT